MITPRLVLATILAAATLSSAPAHSKTITPREDDLAWAIVSKNGHSISGDLDGDPLPKLEDLHGLEFLYIRDRGERYVITDPKSIRRAREAAARINEYSDEINVLANAEARLALANLGEEKHPRLVKRRRELEEEIERLERRGKPTEDLEEELFQVSVELQAHNSIRRNNHLTAEERRDLLKRKDRASARIDEGIRQIHADLRRILADAKERGLAERVDGR